MPSIDELVAQTVAAPKGCKAIEGEARAFLASVRAKQKDGAAIIVVRVQEILKAEWDARIGEEALRKHLRGTCDCED